MTLPDLLELMAKHKAVKVKTADFEVELSPLAFVPAMTGENLTPKTEAIGVKAGNPTADDLLFWSSPLGAPGDEEPEVAP